jgi:8-oxo-dGTP pyrophosphatase MutT (NUDIX family)
MTLPNCAGIIVINKDETILVSTPRGYYSFPKGKRNKNENSHETAYRELWEETGLTKEHIELIDDFSLDEFSRKGNLSVRYFVGKLLKKPEKLTFDAEELQNAEWIKISDAYKLEKFDDKRKLILKQAHEKIEL